MADKINLLPESLANQIAAGEVVERPASVVKELIDNAIDAESTLVKIVIKNAGKSLIQVIDNGSGMTERDARMCFERHATSKIKSTDDLFKISTLGFRGEALAAISAVAQVELTTQRPDDQVGITLRVEGSKLTDRHVSATTPGTTVSVKNLFFNTPARRKFLKSDNRELYAISKEVQQQALANPNIGFELYHNNAEVFKVRPGEKIAQRIVSLLGKQYQKSILPCSEKTHYMELKGYVGRPEVARKTKFEQFMFINNRYINNPYLSHAIKLAYGTLIQDKAKPFYALFLHMDPSKFDINVSPTKTVVKFEDDQLIYSTVQAAVRRALSVSNVGKSIDFDVDSNFAQNLDNPAGNREALKRFEAENPLSTHERQTQPTSHNPKASADWKSALEELQQFQQRFEQTTNPPPQTALTLKSRANTLNNAPNANFSPKQIILVGNTHILAKMPQGLTLFDVRAAQERLLYEQLSQSTQNNRHACQHLAFPERVKVSPTDMQLVRSLLPRLGKLGFDVLPQGNYTLIINGVPAELNPKHAATTLENLLANLKENAPDPNSFEATDHTNRWLSKRLINPDTLPQTPEMAQAFIKKLFEANNPNYTPDGHPVFVTLQPTDLNQIFANAWHS